MSELVLPEPWPAFLKDVDTSLSASVELHCVGGFVLTAVYGMSRPTADIDYLDIIPNDLFSELDEIAGYYSGLRRRHKLFLQRVGIADIPENYADRLLSLDLGLTKLMLKYPDPYDLVLSKLTRNSGKDREDVKYLASRTGLQFPILHDRFEEEMRWIANAAYHRDTLTKFWRDYFPS